jgi:signal peptidase I
VFFKAHYLLKRVIGLPGETVGMRDGTVTIQNGEHPEGFILTEPYAAAPTGFENITLTLGEEEYFVLGDNRPHSFDSRAWGALPGRNIIGHALVRLWPLRGFALWPGQAPPAEQGG